MSITARRTILQRVNYTKLRPVFGGNPDDMVSFRRRRVSIAIRTAYEQCYPIYLLGLSRSLDSDWGCCGCDEGTDDFGGRASWPDDGQYVQNLATVSIRGMIKI